MMTLLISNYVSHTHIWVWSHPWLRILSLINVIMHILNPVAFIFGSLILDAQSCIFNEHEGKLSLSAIKNDLPSFSFLPFCISTFLLFSLHHHHHHYTSFVLTSVLMHSCTPQWDSWKKRSNWFLPCYSCFNSTVYRYLHFVQITPSVN